jgi:hypothetical protein
MIQVSNRPRVYPRLSRGLFLGEVRMAQGMPADQSMANPQMDPVTNLAVNGAILKVQVGVPSSYQQAGGAAAAPQTFSAMIDSGASISCITIQAAQQLNLPQVSSTMLGGVGGSGEAPIYATSLNLVDYGVTVDPVQIAGVSNPLPGVDMLIGRDILRQLDFDYQGSQGAFTIKQTAQAPTTQNQVAAQPPTPGTVAPQGVQPQGNLPQPPPTSTILGMSPLVAAGAGVVAVGAIVGGLFLFKVF